jgi:hypothetical protein
MEVISLIENEIQSYISGEIQTSAGVKHSQYKLVNRIQLFKSQTFPTGKLDSLGNYKHWPDIIKPRVNSEVKNVDFDTGNILIYSDFPEDNLPIFLANAALKEWMRDHGQAEELNDAIEEAAAWGNVVWKKVKGGYERVDLRNFYVINQTAKTLNDTPAIERHELSQTQLRRKKDVYKNVDEVLKHCGNKSFSATGDSTDIHQELPSYEIYERNGEVSLAMLKEAQGKEADPGDEDIYVLAKIVVAGLDRNATENKLILFADRISSMPYKEHHRGPYEERWFRVGLYELLFDSQVRANEIANQIARGLEWASKAIFRDDDQLVAQNILTDLVNGDIIKSKSLQQIEVRMQGLDQLIADWNRNLEHANELANSYEIVTGDSSVSGMPFRLGALQNQNANKLFDFLREKLGLSFQSLFEDWIAPDLMANLRGKDILRITGSSKYLKRFRQMVVDAWYINNLVSLPPHGPDVADALKAQKLEEMQKNPEEMVKLERALFVGVRPRAYVVITAEQTRLQAELESLGNFIGLEQDPVRRSAMIEMAMAKTGMDVGNLPKSDPALLAGAPRVMNAQANDPVAPVAEKIAA